MKRFNRSGSRSGGFTLMELLVVVSIMIILAGLTLGVMSYVGQKQAQEQAKIQLQLLENALEDYYSENGEYPVPRRNSASGARGTNTIFLALFPQNENEKVYLSALDPDNDSQGWISGTNFRSITIVDPWGLEYFYRVNEDGTTYAANPGYDLWSAGPDGETTAGSGGDYDPTDDKNKDDVRTW